MWNNDIPEGTAQEESFIRVPHEGFNIYTLEIHSTADIIKCYVQSCTCMTFNYIDGRLFLRFGNGLQSSVSRNFRFLLRPLQLLPVKSSTHTLSTTLNV